MAIEVTAGAVVYRHGQAGIEYLLLQSMNKGNFWGFPKGHVEAGESLVETATREIKEEISLQVAVDTSFSVYTEYDLPNGNRKQMTLYLADFGAAGSGKTTVAKYLKDTYQMAKVITHTTRAPRPGEVDGVDYYFESPTSIKDRHLLERVEYDGHLYGSSYEGLEAGWAKHPADVIVLDTAGALTYHQALGDQAVVIFLTVSNPQTLAKRIKERGDQLDAVKSRLTSNEYRRDQSLPDYLKGIAHVIVNDDWAQTTQSLDALVAQVAPGVVQSS